MTPDELKALCERLRKHDGHLGWLVEEAADALEAMAADKETFRRAMNVCISDYNKARTLAATLAGLLSRCLKVASSGHWRDGTHLSIEAHPVWDDVRAALAAAREQGVIK